MLTPELTGLPQEVIDLLQNAVISKKKQQGFQVKTATKSTYKYVGGIRVLLSKIEWKYIAPNAIKTSMFGAYALNFVHAYMHEFGYSYDGFNGGVLLFTRGLDKMAISKEGDKWVFKTYNDEVVYRTMERVPGSTRYEPREYHEAELLNMPLQNGQPVTAEMLTAWSQWQFIGEDKDADTHICNIFADIQADGAAEGANGIVGVKFNNNTLINGKPWREGRSLISITGRPMNALMWKVVLYNDCEIGSTGSYSSGNFGQCALSFYGENAPEADSIVLTTSENPTPGSWQYNPNRANAVLQIELCETPMPEKNGRDEGYVNLKTGQRMQTLRG